MSPTNTALTSLLTLTTILLSTPANTQFLVTEFSALDLDLAACTGIVLDTFEGPNTGSCFTATQDPPTCLRLERTPATPQKACNLWGFPKSTECIGETDLIIGVSDFVQDDAVDFESVFGPYRSFYVTCSLDGTFPPAPPNGTGLP